MHCQRLFAPPLLGHAPHSWRRPCSKQGGAQAESSPPPLPPTCHALLMRACIHTTVCTYIIIQETPTSQMPPMKVQYCSLRIFDHLLSIHFSANSKLLVALFFFFFLLHFFFSLSLSPFIPRWLSRLCMPAQQRFCLRLQRRAVRKMVKSADSPESFVPPEDGHLPNSKSKFVYPSFIHCSDRPKSTLAPEPAIDVFSHLHDLQSSWVHPSCSSPVSLPFWQNPRFQ